MLDSFGRDVDYLRVSLTDRCNLRCIYCMPEAGIAKVDHNEILRFEEVLQVVRAFASLGGRKIRYTGGEPLILKGIEKLIAETAKISSVQDIAITTNGTFLYDMAIILKQAGLKRVNISLDTLQPDKYSRITRGGNINKVFQSIEKCLSIGLNPIKINTVLIKGINDDELKDFIELTRNYPVDVRFIELMPLGEGKKYFQEGKMSSQEALDRFPALLPVLGDYKSTAQMYKLKGAKGRVGFISPLSCKFCASCNRLRLTSTGTLKPCLHSKEEVGIKEHLGNQIALAGILKSTIFGKPQEHLLDSEGISKSAKMMFQIGG